MLSEKDRHLVDIATKVLDDFNGDFGCVFSGWCLTGLPHKRIPSDQSWILDGDVVGLLVTPGRLAVYEPRERRKGEPEVDQDGYVVDLDSGERYFVLPEHRPPKLALREVRYGVPYGAHARLILHFLQKQAVKTNNPRVELGQSMRHWLQQMGVSWGGNTIRQFQTQAQSIAAAHIQFRWKYGETTGWGKGGFLQMGAREEAGGEPKIWDDEVVLDPLYFQALLKHGTPVSDAAIRALQNRSMSLDIYTYLAWRLHALSTPVKISWAALMVQFGHSFEHLRSFKQAFTLALKPALAAYPNAIVDLTPRGVTLYPCDPPIAKTRPTLTTRQQNLFD